MFEDGSFTGNGGQPEPAKDKNTKTIILEITAPKSLSSVYAAVMTQSVLGNNVDVRVIGTKVLKTIDKQLQND